MSDQPQPERPAKVVWNEAGEQLQGLGAKLRQHYEQHHQQHPQQDGSRPAAEAGAEFADLARAMGVAVQNAAESLGAAVRDPGIQDDVRQVGRTLAAAVAGSLAGLTGEVRRNWAAGPQPDGPQPDGPQPDGPQADGPQAEQDRATG